MANKNTIFIAFASLLIGGALGFSAMQFTNKPTEAQTESKAKTNQPTVEKAPEVTTQASNTNFNLDPITIGNPDAKIELTEYASLGDKKTADTHINLLVKLNPNYIDNGKVKFTFKNFPNNQNSLFATMVTACISPENKMSFINELFAKQESWAAQPTPIADLKSIAANHGLTGQNFYDCIENKTLSEKIISTQREIAETQNIRQSPSFSINNEKLEGVADAEIIIASIEAVLSGKSANAELQKIANEVLALQPNEQFLGSETAPVTIVEYASLSCPHCAKFYKEIYPALKKDFIDTGKVKFIYRNFPLNEPAVKAAMISECVEKPKFFEIVEALYLKQEEWSFSEDFIQKLKEISSQYGLTEEAFNTCLANKELENKVMQTPFVAKLKLGIDSTPTFFVNGKKTEHVHNIAEFKQAIEAAK